METGVSWMSLYLTHYMGAGVIGQRMGDVTPMTSPYESFRTRDGSVLITAANDKLFEAVCRALGLPALASDPRFAGNALRVANRPELHALLEARTSELETTQCVARLREAGAPCAPINTVDAVPKEPQVEAMRMNPAAGRPPTCPTSAPWTSPWPSTARRRACARPPPCWPRIPTRSSNGPATRPRRSHRCGRATRSADVRARASARSRLEVKPLLSQ